MKQRKQLVPQHSRKHHLKPLWKPREINGMEVGITTVITWTKEGRKGLPNCYPDA